MKVVVMGAGIIGVTTAWTLAQAGFEVTLVDRQPKAANETSKGNACLLCTGHTQVWNNPSAPLTHLRSLFQKDPVSGAKFINNPGFLSWCIRFLGSCRSHVSNHNTLLSLQLATRSAELTRDIITTHHFDVSMTTKGALYWHDTVKSLDLDRQHCDFLNSQGVDAHILEANELRNEEPAFQNSQRSLVGALHMPNDLSANCPEFAQQLLELAVKGGNVRLLSEHAIKTIEQNNQKITAIETSQGRLDADHFVLALGPESGLWAKTLNLNVPIAPAKGYSLTVAVNPNVAMPIHAGIDINQGVALAPLRNQLRITSYGKFEGFDRTWKANNFMRHQNIVNDLFPGLVLWEKERNEWAGLRPITSDGIPVIGKAKPYNNLWLNTGHGSLGWTQAAASAELLLQKMTGAPRTAFSDAFEYRW